ncbi:hypothetical protein F3N42_14170 [Marinihelvus fidelis]|uniref:Lipoprotein n=1 Tax=Marinihelvus fidelis TaxID=2613842 RepID=A0A5N0T3Z8_9GAMM|nr:hypothetical protein [Marinihelvus fidelis]KAA9129795.1 hypothetical protein F3N42_14170 [Marinihelvus fidelis]
MRTTKIVTAISTMLVLSACMAQPAPNGAGGVEVQEVKLQVKGNPKELGILSGANNRCKNPNNKVGCVRVGEGKTGLVTFRLLQSNQWTLSAMTICDGSSKPETCKLSAAGMSDFTAARNNLEVSPDANGWIDLAQLGSPLDEFQVVDLNRTKADYFYNIQACPTDGSEECLWLDPPWENDGTGINH